MGKGLGICGFVLAILAIFLPIIGILIGWLALVLAVLAALAGDVILTVSIIMISIVNFIFLSPSLWLATIGAHFVPGVSSPYALVIITIILVLAPILCLILRQAGMVRPNHPRRLAYKNQRPRGSLRLRNTRGSLRLRGK